MRPHERLYPRIARFLASLAVAAFLAGALAPVAGAADRYWVRWVDDYWDYLAFHSDSYGSYGVWSAAYPVLNDQGGASVPAAGDDVYLVKPEMTGWNTNTTLWMQNYTSSSRLSSLTIDGPIPYDPSHPYVMTLYQRANLAVGAEFVGLTGASAQHVQMTGTNDISGDLSIGWGGNGRGYYQLSSGCQLLVGGTEYVGRSGWGSFTQEGGTHTITGNLRLADNAHSYGFFTLNDGTLRAANIIVADETDTFSYVTQGGGRVDTGDLILAGWCAGSHGNYYLNAGTLALTGSAFVGMQGLSTFQQTGGTQTIAGSLYVARWSGARATYYQYGGTTDVSGDTYVGQKTGADGALRVSSGTLTTSSLTLGGDLGSPGGKGVLTIETGGTVTVNGPLKVWETPGSVINLSGGRLNAATLDFGADPSRLQWSSGTLNLSASDMALTEGSLLGTSLTLPATKSLMVGGSFYMGVDEETEERLVTLNGGTHTVGYGLNVGVGDGHHGKYVLNSGRLAAGGVTLGGYGGRGEFYQWGGTTEIAGAIVLNPDSTPLNQACCFQLNYGTLTADSVYVYDYGRFEQKGGDLRVGEFHLCGGSATGVLQNRGTLFFDDTTYLYAKLLNEGGIVFTVPEPNIVGGLVNTSATPLDIHYGVTLYVGGPGLSNDGVINVAGGLKPSSCTVGDAATGTINQPWGHHQSHHDVGVLTLGNQAGATGNYNLSFGTLTAAAEYIGYNGHARFDQTGGTNQVNGNFTVAAYPGADGTYLLSDGGSLGVAGNAIIGDAGAGLFHQTGGTHRVEGSLYLGHATGGSGTYELSDTGSLVVVGSEYIGFGAGTGKFTQTGGSHGVGGTIHVGTDTGGAGSYSLDEYGEVDSLVLQIHRRGTFTLGGGGVITAATVNQNGTLNVTGDALVCSVVNFNYGSATTIDGCLRATGTLNNNGQTLVGSGGLNLDHGLLSGWGTVALDTITSSGSIVARNGNLVLSAATLFTNTGLLQNNVGASLFVEAPVILNGGPMTVNAGGAVSFSQPVTNAAGKTISLLGGTLAARALTNLSGGTVSGFGQITGDVYNNGTVDLYGPTQIVGNLANNDGASLTVSNVQTLVTGSTINFGYLHTVNGTIIFHGGFTNYGVYESDPSTQCFQDLTVNPSGTVTGGAGDRFIVSGNFTNQSTRTDTWNTAAAELRFDGGGTHTLTLGSAAGAMAWGKVVVERGNALQVAGEAPWCVAGELALEGAVVSGNAIVASGTLRATKGASTMLCPVSFEGNAAVVVEALADRLDLRGHLGAAEGSVVTKTGAGTLVLSAGNTGSGDTHVLEGTLLVENTTGSGTGTGPVTVGPATLGGTGFINGPVTLTGDSTLTSTGTLTIKNTLDVQGEANQLPSGTVATTGDVTIEPGAVFIINGTLGGGTGYLVVRGTLMGKGTINKKCILDGGVLSPGSPSTIQGQGQVLAGAAPQTFSFEIGAAEPNYASPSNSVNDVVRLTDAAAPFADASGGPAALTADTVIDVYFLSADPRPGGYEAAFFAARDFSDAVAGATYEYWRLDPRGSRYHNGNFFSPLDEGLVDWSVAPETAVFGGAPASGYITEFVVAPEPATLALVALGVAGTLLSRRRRGR